jgi:hypothetical protein
MCCSAQARAASVSGSTKKIVLWRMSSKSALNGLAPDHEAAVADAGDDVCDEAMLDRYGRAEAR